MAASAGPEIERLATKRVGIINHMIELKDRIAKQIEDAKK